MLTTKNFLPNSRILFSPWFFVTCAGVIEFDTATHLEHLLLNCTRTELLELLSLDY